VLRPHQVVLASRAVVIKAAAIKFYKRIKPSNQKRWRASAIRCSAERQGNVAAPAPIVSKGAISQAAANQRSMIYHSMPHFVKQHGTSKSGATNQMHQSIGA